MIARTGGNPFFLEETVRTLVETGVLVGTSGAYRLMQALPSIQVPATVQAVLAARIDRLPLEVKRLLQVAAVIGMEIPLPLLHTVAEVSEEALHRSLAQLQAAEFLYETRLFPEREYTFKHALTHEVAYGGLRQERRRALHAQIVEAIEALAGDRLTEQVEHLAHHALRGEVWDKARTYCRQAGEKAQARSAYREAVGYFAQALSALQHLPGTRDIVEQAIDLRLALRTALFASGDLGRILAALREAESLAVTLDDSRRLGQVSRFLAIHFYFMGTYDQAIAAAQRVLALALAEELGMRPLVAHCHRGLGTLYRQIGQLEEARAALSTAIAQYRAMEMTFWLPQAEAALDVCFVSPAPVKRHARVGGHPVLMECGSWIPACAGMTRGSRHWQCIYEIDI